MLTGYIKKNKFIVILFALAILSGLFWSGKNLFAPPPATGDAVGYNYLAKNIIQHGSPNAGPDEGEHFTAFNDPFYPIFLAGVYFVFGFENVIAVRFVQLILFVVTVVLVYFLAKDFLSERTARLAAILTALFFPLANSVGYLNREVLLTFLAVFLVYALYQTQKTIAWKWFLISGVIFSIAVMTKGVFQFFIVFIVVNFILIFKKQIFQRQILLKSMASLVLIAGIFIFWHSQTSGNSQSLNIQSGPVLGRKAEMMALIKGEIYWRHLGGLVLGYYFFEKPGFNVYGFMIHQNTTDKLKELGRLGLPPAEISRQMFKENIRQITGDPFHFMAISFLDFVQFNGPMLPNPSSLQTGPMQNLFINDSYPELGRNLKIFILIFLELIYWSIFGLVIYGIAKSLKNWYLAGWAILMIVYLNLVYSAVFGLPRYAIPIWPFYLIFLALGLTTVISWIKPRILKSLKYEQNQISQT